MSQYIGKTISLISNKGLRYVGLLDNINPDDATVALKSVRSLGSEGRLAQAGMPNLEVMAGNDVYDYVVFRGSDVKDLTVLDIPVDQVKPEPYTPTPAPTAAYYQQPVETTSQQQIQQQTSTSGNVEAHPAPVQASPKQTAAPQTTKQQQQQQQQQPTPTPTQPTYPTPTQDQNNAQPEQRTEPTKNTSETDKHKDEEIQDPKPVSRPQKAKGPEVPQEAFDFESANAKFAREVLQEKENSGVSYDKKSSFFDTISSSNEERGSMRWSEEKSLNMDTFGESSIGNRNRGRGRGRGRGGWRGRGRSRGRGNNYKNSTPEWA